MFNLTLIASKFDLVNLSTINKKSKIPTSKLGFDWSSSYNLTTAAMQQMTVTDRISSFLVQ
jgi:hypothetical protein